MTNILIPKGYTIVAATEEQYRKVTVTVYKNEDSFIVRTTDHINEDDRLWGPFDVRELYVVHHVLGDVLWKAGIKG